MLWENLDEMEEADVVQSTKRVTPEKAINLMEATSGKYIASELKTIKDEATKRKIKFQIQSMISSVQNENHLPMSPGLLNYGYPTNPHYQWDMHSGSLNSSSSHTKESTPPAY